MIAVAVRSGGEPDGAGCVVWVTGLPASGKSTLARAARRVLASSGLAACVLDGDEVRSALVPPPGYSPEDRDAFYATLARVAALLARQGLVVLVPATAHRAEYREAARRLAPGFLEVYVGADAATCAARDPKGLYVASSKGELRGLPGRDAPYQAPANADVVASGGLDGAAVERLVRLVLALQRPPEGNGVA